MPCRLRTLSIFSTFDMLKLTISPQAKRAETDPRQGTPTRAHLQPPERGLLVRFGRFPLCRFAVVYRFDPCAVLAPCCFFSISCICRFSRACRQHVALTCVFCFCRDGHPKRWPLQFPLSMPTSVNIIRSAWDKQRTSNTDITLGLSVRLHPDAKVTNERQESLQRRCGCSLQV